MQEQQSLGGRFAAVRKILLDDAAIARFSAFWQNRPRDGDGRGMMGPVRSAYLQRVAAGEIEHDSAQERAAGRLDHLASELSDWRPAKGGLRSLFFRPKVQPTPPQGVYLHGAVGRGKTMLMDIFHETLSFQPRRRLHFHEFMAEAHERIQRGRATTDGDPIPGVAAEIAAEAQLLCFDELAVSDIADAMILGRLFKGLFERGVVLVATSNVLPQRLYWDGLNRQLFLPFIELLVRSMDVLELKSAKDFRLDKLSGRQLYYAPCDAVADAGIEDHWRRLTGHHAAERLTLSVMGRAVDVPRAAMGVARFSFADLCAKPLGSLDYLHIAHTFHTVIVEGIPVLTPDRRNEARRFIHLVDTLYDNRICLIASAEAQPQDLYREGDGAILFERTVSRLTEMRSEAYLEARARES